MKKSTSPQVDLNSAGIAKRGNYTKVLQTIIDQGMCPFCEKNILIHHKKPILFKNKYWVVTTNAWPYPGTKHHFLLISRLHIEALEDGSSEILKGLHVAYKKLCKLYDIKGSSLFIRSGDTAYTGATVRHLHAQIIVGKKRKASDKSITAIVGYQRG